MESFKCLGPFLVCFSMNWKILLASICLSICPSVHKYAKGEGQSMKCVQMGACSGLFPNLLHFTLMMWCLPAWRCSLPASFTVDEDWLHFAFTLALYNAHGCRMYRQKILNLIIIIFKCASCLHSRGGVKPVLCNCFGRTSGWNFEWMVMRGGVFEWETRIEEI